MNRSFFLKHSLYLLVVLSLVYCQPNRTTPSMSQLENSASQLRNFDSITQAKVMVLGTFHFDKSVLESNDQQSLEELVGALTRYRPTKIVLELEPRLSDRVNSAYQQYLTDSFEISTRENEVFQLGFRLAKNVGHDSLYLFDDQTEYIGSLNNFSFDALTQYAAQYDSGFYDRYSDLVTCIYQHNLDLFEKHDLAAEIALRNSPQAQKSNARRMHSFEVRVGIQKSWIGPDWLGRWYRRNVRMMTNILKMTEKGDRILIIVGDNHKWTLDAMFQNTPDFEVVSSWEFLKKYIKETPKTDSDQAFP